MIADNVTLGSNVSIPLTGITVSRDPDAQDPLVYREAQAAAKLIGLRDEVPRSLIKTDGGLHR